MTVQELIKKLNALPGDAIVYKGDSALNLFFIRSGSVVIVLSEGDSTHAPVRVQFPSPQSASNLVAVDGGGTRDARCLAFGDISFFTEANCSRTVRAADNCEVLALDMDSYQHLLSLYPEYQASIFASWAIYADQVTINYF